MIRGFRHKGLERFFRRSEARGIPGGNAARIWRILDLLDAATKPDEMAVPGYRLHELKGNRAGTYSVTVSGNWRITFAFEGEDAVQVNLEHYH